MLETASDLRDNEGSIERPRTGTSRPGPRTTPCGGADVMNATCSHGHPFDEANTYIGSHGRVCRECARPKKRARRAAARAGVPGPGRYVRVPMQARFWARVDRRDPDYCWLWVGPLNSNGYAVISEGGRRGRGIRAHRYAYELLVGPIPEGLHLDHLCRVRHCVNPKHLEPVTKTENARRAQVRLPRVAAGSCEGCVCPCHGDAP